MILICSLKFSIVCRFILVKGGVGWGGVGRFAVDKESDFENDA
jgi:hypothetical protein